MNPSNCNSVFQDLVMFLSQVCRHFETNSFGFLHVSVRLNVLSFETFDWMHVDLRSVLMRAHFLQKISEKLPSHRFCLIDLHAAECDKRILGIGLLSVLKYSRLYSISLKQPRNFIGHQCLPTETYCIAISDMCVCVEALEGVRAAQPTQKKSHVFTI